MDQNEMKKYNTFTNRNFETEFVFAMTQYIIAAGLLLKMSHLSTSFNSDMS